MSLLVLGAGLVLAAPAAAVDYPIGFRSYVYAPSSLEIALNDTVTFSGQNGEDFGDHPLVWTGGVPSTTNTGSSMQFTQFTHPGTYSYYCQLHVNSENMRGTITVVDKHPANVSFSVSPASPKVGQPVTFTYTGDSDPDGTLVSWQWDLDGNGSLETTTPGPAATTTYASPGTVTVRMRAVDNFGEASTTAEQVVTISAASSGSGGSGSPGGGASGSRDTTAPRATLIKLRGLKLSFRASERASATATLRARGKTVAKGSAKAKAGALAIRLKLTSAGRSMLARGHKLKATLNLTLRDSAGNRRTVKKTLTVRRR